MIDDSLLDQLAEYAAGLLDPVEAQVLERRLAADPALATLAAELTGAQQHVAADLGALAVEPMPPAVADRLAGLLAAAPAGESAHEPESPGVPAGLPSAPPGSRRPGGRRPSDQRPGSRRTWRRPGWVRTLLAGGGVAAAVALVLGGFLLLNNGATKVRSSATAGTAADSAKAPLFQSGLVIRHTASDYSADTLPTGPDGVQAPGAQAASGTGAGMEALLRLNDPTALADCLTVLTSLHPGTVEIVEFARYEGRPALIVVMTGGSGSRTVVAGPDCGLPGASDDEVFVTPPR